MTIYVFLSSLIRFIAGQLLVVVLWVYFSAHLALGTESQGAVIRAISNTQIRNEGLTLVLRQYPEDLGCTLHCLSVGDAYSCVLEYCSDGVSNWCSDAEVSVCTVNCAPPRSAANWKKYVVQAQIRSTLVSPTHNDLLWSDSSTIVTFRKEDDLMPWFVRIITVKRKQKRNRRKGKKGRRR